MRVESFSKKILIYLNLARIRTSLKATTTDNKTQLMSATLPAIIYSITIHKLLSLNKI